MPNITVFFKNGAKTLLVNCGDISALAPFKKNIERIDRVYFEMDKSWSEILDGAIFGLQCVRNFPKFKMEYKVLKLDCIFDIEWDYSKNTPHLQGGKNHLSLEYKSQV
jgi:hypothetical protein